MTTKYSKANSIEDDLTWHGRRVREKASELFALFEEAYSTLQTVYEHIAACRVADNLQNPQIGHGWESVTKKADIEELEQAFQLCKEYFSD